MHARYTERVSYNGLENIKVVLYERNSGKGTALRTGFDHVTGDIIIIQNADLKYDFANLPNLIKPIIEGKSDIVYDSSILSNKMPALNGL